MVLSAGFVWAQDSPSRISEREVKVGSGEWAVDGTLTIPAGKGPFPAVLFIPGSGMGDRDLTIGAHKMFREMAQYFAERGIVSLRIEKRLRQHVDKFRERQIMPSLRTEYLDDAVTATRLLSTFAEVDPKRVYVLGHSQGATFAPLVARQAGDVAGVIILSGSTRKPGEMIVEQATHVLAQPNISDDERKGANEALAAGKQLQNLPKDDNAFVAGMPVSYWRAFYDYDAAAEAASLHSRVLVIQQGRDYEVTDKDLAGWQKELDGRKNVTLRRYPNLNHVFQEGTGPSTPEEYEKLGGPSPDLLKDLAEWIRQ
jgi:dienelactone hydrolase